MSSRSEGEAREEPFVDQAFAASADAYASAPKTWEESIQAAIASLFDFLASRPDQTNACIVNHCGAGPAALARRDRTIDRFVELLRPGFATAAVPPPPVIAEAIGGGIYELVRSHVLEQRLEELPDAVADATIIALSPFMAAADAIALAEQNAVGPRPSSATPPLQLRSQKQNPPMPPRRAPA